MFFGGERVEDDMSPMSGIEDFDENGEDDEDVELGDWIDGKTLVFEDDEEEETKYAPLQLHDRGDPV